MRVSNIIRQGRHRGHLAIGHRREVPLSHPALHIASTLELVGRLGSVLLLGVMLGLVLDDLEPCLHGGTFSGASLVAAGMLGVMVLPVGLACWLAGRKLRHERDEPPALPAAIYTLTTLLVLAVGAAGAWWAGLPPA